MKCKYRCVKCKEEFTDLHFREVRFATGRTVEHCGQAAFWLGEVKESE